MIWKSELLAGLHLQNGSTWSRVKRYIYAPIYALSKGLKEIVRFCSSERLCRRPRPPNRLLKEPRTTTSTSSVDSYFRLSVAAQRRGWLQSPPGRGRRRSLRCGSFSALNNPPLHPSHGGEYLYAQWRLRKGDMRISLKTPPSCASMEGTLIRETSSDRRTTRCQAVLNSTLAFSCS